jgi:hypothetical protein
MDPEVEVAAVVMDIVEKVVAKSQRRVSFAHGTKQHDAAHCKKRPRIGHSKNFVVWKSRVERDLPFPYNALSKEARANLFREVYRNLPNCSQRCVLEYCCMINKFH